MVASAHLDCDLNTFCGCLRLCTLWVKVLLCFYLRATITVINDKMRNPRWWPVAILNVISMLHDMLHVVQPFMPYG